MRVRKPWIAVLLTLGCPGLGHVYLGQAARGVTLFCAVTLVALLLAFLPFRLVGFPLNLPLTLVGTLGGVVGIAGDAVRRINRHEVEFRPKTYNRWYVYVLLHLAGWIAQEVITRPMLRACTQAFRIPSGSMISTLAIGDHVLADKAAYAFAPIRRGDVIVYRYPRDETRSLLHRVIGVSGETLEIRGTAVFINGTRLNEPYAQYGDWPVQRFGERPTVGPLTIPANQLFILGDNRDHSMDSRVWGFLDAAQVEGKVVGIYFSWDADAGRVRWARIGRPVR
jgi:signal peptidase I